MKKRKLKRAKRHENRIATQVEAYLSREDRTCLHCGANHPENICAFIANRESAHLFGGVPGYERQMFYSICDECHEKDPKHHAAELRLQESAQRVLANFSEHLDNFYCLSCRGVPDMFHTIPVRGGIFATCDYCRKNVKQLMAIINDKIESGVENTFHLDENGERLVVQ